MIDFNKLDKRSKYCLLEYGTGLIAKQIKRFSKEYCPNTEEIPTHVAMAVFRLGSWWIYESHAKAQKEFGIPSGVRRYKLEKWLKVENPEKFKAFKVQLDFKEMEEHIGESYGIGDIKALMHAAIHHTNGKQKDRKGLICSEYFALCCKDLRKYFKELPCWCITPAHIQYYLIQTNKKEVGNGQIHQ